MLMLGFFDPMSCLPFFCYHCFLVESRKVILSLDENQKCGCGEEQEWCFWHNFNLTLIGYEYCKVGPLMYKMSHQM